MAINGTEATKRVVTAFFDERAAAQQAVDDLLAAGVARLRITLVEGGQDPVATTPDASAGKGLWATVRDLFMADEDRHAYGEGLRRGGVLLSVVVGGDEARIVEILDRDGAVDLDARQNDWELEGWDPARAAADLRAFADPGPVSASAIPATSAPDDLRRAIEPAAAVGPAFGTGASPVPPRGAVVRDAEADGLRLRTYVESRGPEGGVR